MNKQDDNTPEALYGKRSGFAWYWRRCGDNRPEGWSFYQYGRPSHFYLQRDYLEIRT